MKVNYNVTGDDRKALVKVIGEAIGEKPKYLGMPSAAFRIGSFTVSKTGELECEDGSDTETVLEAIAAAGFVSETDTDDAEMDIPDDNEEDFTEEASEPLVDGLTVEISRSFFTGNSLDNLRKLVDSKASLIKEALGADELPINVTDAKVSFPWFREPEADSCAAYTHFISKLCEMAKNATRVTASDHAVENPKYAMRCWLLRLGFIGTEYKSARKILLKNLSGNSSWKNGRKEDSVDDAAE